MSYTKNLVGNITEGVQYLHGNKRLQAFADVVDDNLTDIETALNAVVVEGVADVVGAMFTSGNTLAGVSFTYQDSDNTMDVAVAYGTSASTACVGNDSRLSDARTPTAHNLVDGTGHAVTGLTTDHVLKATGATTYGFGALPSHSHSYQPLFSGSTTLTDLGIVPPTNPAWSGTAMSALTGSSTFQQLLNAIDTDIATAATLPAL